MKASDTEESLDMERDDDICSVSQCELLLWRGGALLMVHRLLSLHALHPPR